MVDRLQSYNIITTLSQLPLCVFYIATLRDGTYVATISRCTFIMPRTSRPDTRVRGRRIHLQSTLSGHRTAVLPAPVPSSAGARLQNDGASFGLHEGAECLSFLVFLLLFYRLIRADLPLPYIISILLTLGLNPYIWALKDQVVSEFLFLLVMCLCCRTCYRGGCRRALMKYPSPGPALNSCAMALRSKYRSLRSCYSPPRRSRVPVCALVLRAAPTPGHCRPAARIKRLTSAGFTYSWAGREHDVHPVIPL
jgi:hypothetical protein